MHGLVVDTVELQHVKDALAADSLNAGIGVLHESSGTIRVRPFDEVPGGHGELAGLEGWPLNECRGFVIVKGPDGSLASVNSSHLNGLQGSPGSLQMAPDLFTTIQDALKAAGLETV